MIISIGYGFGTSCQWARRRTPVGIAYKHRDKNEAQIVTVVRVVEVHVRAVQAMS